MRQIHPHLDDVDPVATYLTVARPAPADRPWVTVGMVASLDGATALDGRSGGLGGDADRMVFRAVRGIADVILVAAGTVRAEGYGPARLSEAVRAARVSAGRSPEAPRIAIVTASLELDLDGDLFRAAGPGPIVLTTTDADPDRLASVAEVAEVRTAGQGRVDLREALGSLGADATVVVCEGGPSLNGALVDADLVDEWCVSIAPVVAGGDSRRLVHGAQSVEAPPGLRLASLLTEDGVLFGRWVRD